jgi:hypothetical protein
VAYRIQSSEATHLLIGPCKYCCGLHRGACPTFWSRSRVGIKAEKAKYGCLRLVCTNKPPTSATADLQPLSPRETHKSERSVDSELHSGHGCYWRCYRLGGAYLGLLQSMQEQQSNFPRPGARLSIFGSPSDRSREGSPSRSQIRPYSRGMPANCREHQGGSPYQLLRWSLENIEYLRSGLITQVVMLSASSR